MVLVINNTCNRDCPFCFEGDFRHGPAQMMSVDDLDVLCGYFRIAQSSPDDRVTLLGGEPTLHPQLLEIVDLIRDHCPNKQVLLLTNLACERELLAELLMRRVNVLVNIVPPELNTPEQQAAIDANIDMLSEAPGCIYAAAVTIASLDQDFGFFYDVLRRDRHHQIFNVRVGLSAPGYEFGNEFVADQRPEWGEKYLEVVRQMHRINPMISVGNECAVNLCMMRPETYAELAPHVGYLSAVCTQPNLDILPDFSTHWCFGSRHLPGMRIENIFDYPDEQALIRELNQRRVDLMREMGMQCDHAECDTLRCHGPCLALNYYLAQERQHPGA
jgi:sulfatase maturation enzyme AslB (radical SAM superfamily)